MPLKLESSRPWVIVLNLIANGLQTNYIRHHSDDHDSDVNNGDNDYRKNDDGSDYDNDRDQDYVLVW